MDLKVKKEGEYIGSSLVSEQEIPIELQITIKDTGAGIKQEDLAKLFVDFGKLDDEEGRNTSGTGLGLSICKQLIEKMGGTVTVKSEVGKGTDFVINLKTKYITTKIEYSN